MDIYKELVSELLPEGILTYFNIVSLTQEENQTLKIHLEEKNLPPEEHEKKHIRANGFLLETQIKDFPLRTKLVTLCVKRRRWLLVAENKKVMRDLSLKAPGTRLTNEFALFLKDLLDKYPIASQSLEKHYGISGKTIQRHYKHQLSEYKQWEQKSHCEDYLLFPDNIGPYLSIDETAFSQGELYTIVTNKANKGKKGSIVAMIKGTNSEEIIPILLKLSNSKRLMVKEMTLDMAGSMNRIVRTCFPRAQKVIDRFHVQKLVYDAVQAIRIKHRWIAIEEENDGQVCIYDNGDSKKQLLARSRYLLFKAKSKWTFSQCNRAKLLFKEFPDIEKAYIIAQKLGFIYENTTVKGIAFTRLAKWFKTIEDSGFKSFDSIRRTFEKHYVNILNFFDNRSTNAAAESFNAKNKDFRRNLRGIRDVKFFLFRLSKIYS